MPSATPPSQTTLSLPFTQIKVEAHESPFAVTLDYGQDANTHIALLTLESESPHQPPQLKLKWELPAAGILCCWRPDKGTKHILPANWEHKDGLTSYSASQAPVICLHTTDGKNRLTIAADDALHPVKMSVGLNEYNASFDCEVQPFLGEREPARCFKFKLRLDDTPVPFYTALRHVSEWWESLPGHTPIPVPDAGTLPVYSTWYSFHQSISSPGIEQQCNTAKSIGCASVIVDDGWQTNDSSGGYSYTGDWQPERLQDIRDSVERVHTMGMRYILWYSVPFIGFKSQQYQRFKNHLLYTNERLNCGVLDPRYPEVRNYLVSTYQRALHEWDLDGFKLDFIDAFKLPQEGALSTAPGRDYSCVYEAVDRLMRDIADTLLAIKPDMLIEFRQTYIGPKMRRYGNLFRVADCPMDISRNRTGMVDIRLLCGSSAAHSDMLMWHPNDTVENAAKQLLNVFFCVPQISMLLNSLPTQHLQMLRHYLAFWTEHRETLLHGCFEPEHPEFLYPRVSAHTEHESIIALYQQNIAELPPCAKPLTHIINATDRHELYLVRVNTYHGIYRTYACTGELTATGILESSPIVQLDVPPSGRVELIATSIR